jgi:membrane fusion protein, multidrug efflux system
VNKSRYAAPLAASIALLLAACSAPPPSAEVHRPVRTVALRYDDSSDAHRYFAAVQSRYEVEQAFRVAGKVSERRVDVGQNVRAGEVLAVLDAGDYRLAEEAARRQLDAANARWRQAKSDLARLQALKQDGSVSDADEEHARSGLATAEAAAKAEARRLELARNQVTYTTLRASRDGVVTAVRIEVGQVIAAGQPAIAVADPGEPEIVADVPEDHREQFQQSRFQAVLASATGQPFAVELRELSAQASAQTRTFRARLRPASPRALPLGTSATLIADRIVAHGAVAAVPAAALTQHEGGSAVWVATPQGDGAPLARVALVPVTVHGYRNEEVLLSGPADGALVVTAGVQKMRPELVVALPPASPSASPAALAQRSTP